MTLFQAFLLGIVQGLTEFLPISSSGHLVLMPALLRWEIPADQAFVFNVLVQLGTLAAVLAYFRRDLIEIVRGMWQGIREKRPFASDPARLGWNLVVATIPAGLVGLLIKEQVEAAFASPIATALFLLGTAALLVMAERTGRGEGRAEQVTAWDAFWIGCFQILAIFPGVSRSGSTIAGGMARRLSRAEAARFSFLMSVPVMLAAGALSLLDLAEVDHLTGFLPSLILGFVTSAVTGYLAIRWLVGYLKKGSLYGFVVYVIALSLISLGLLR